MASRNTSNRGRKSEKIGETPAPAKRDRKQKSFVSTASSGFAALKDQQDAEEQEYRLQRLSEARRQLTPSRLMLIEKVGNQIATAAAARPDHRFLVVARVFSADWIDAAAKAIRVAAREVWIDPFVQFTVMAATPDGVSRDVGLIEPSRIPQILAGQQPCICMALPTNILPAIVEAAADIVVDIDEPSRDDLADALGLENFRQFPESISASVISPNDLDFAIERGRNPAERLQLISKIRGHGVDPDGVPAEAAEDNGVRGPILEELHGYGKAKEWGLQLKIDVESYRAGEIGWRDVDGGCLLVGPPGTGKTLFAEALAASTAMHLVATSYSAWQSHRSGHLGDVTRAIRDDFKRAKENAPSLLFIDEIDTLQGRGSGGRSDHAAWFTAVGSAVLEGLDGIDRREGIVVVAACNDDSGLDPALIRSGRLDRRFYVGFPDEEALAAIFRRHLGDDIDDVSIARVSTLFAGTYCGADVVRIARDARRRARRERRPLASSDLIAEAIPMDSRPLSVRRRIAVHEAGHAVAQLVYGQILTSLSLVESSGRAGAVASHRAPGQAEGLRAELNREVVAALAGRAAEETLLGAPSAGAGGSEESDLAHATRLLSMAEAYCGLGSSLTYARDLDRSLIERRLARLYGEACLLVMQHKEAILALAALALEERVLGRVALENFAASYRLLPESKE